MKISLNWLKDYVEFDKKLSVKDIAWRLTEATAEIEKTHILGKDLNKVVIGKLLEVSKHPDADKLKVCKVDVGEETLQIVCGGTNLREKMLVAVSLPGAMVRWHGEGDLVEVKVVKLRGVESTGMICASDEISLGKMFPAEESVILDLSSYKAKPGQEIKEVLGMDDVVFEVDNHSITHRSDLFSHLGFACECVALGIAKWKKKLKEADPRSLPGKKKLPLKVEFQRNDISKNYFGTVIENLSTKESPAWMKARLSAVGIRSINAIIDITNYIMMDVGQPNHAFDWRVLEGKTFINRLSKKGEIILTLDGVKRELPEGIIIAETENGIIDLAGVMGGKSSEIQTDTTSVYFHSSQFNNTLIRKAMIFLGHRTDGGTMHEKNIEAQRSEFGYYRGLTLFKKIFPEAVFPYETIHIQHEKNPEISIDLPLQKVSSHLGIEIPGKVVKGSLINLGFEVSLIKGGFRVKVPTWRSNSISIPEDLVEEVARIYGYSNIPAQPPTVELVTPHRVHKRHVKRIAQHFLVSQGFQEEVNFSFLSEMHLRNIGQGIDAEIIEIKNPVSDDFRFMRPNFLPYLLSNLSRNQIMQKQIWKTFEMGAVYTRRDDEVLEQHRLTFVVATEQESFFQAKGIVEGLFRELSLVAEVRGSEHTYAYPGRYLQVLIQGNSVGHVYDLHPLLIEQFGLKGSVAIGDIDLNQLYQLRSEDVFYKTLNRNPEALLDVSVVVDQTMMMSDVESIIRSVEEKYLKKAQLLDVYEGKSIGEGKKSLTFSLAYQHPDRTLDEKEIQAILDALIKKLENSGGVVRR